MDRRTGKSRLRAANRRWEIGLAISVLAVVIGIVGVVLVRADVLSRPWTYVFLAVAVLGALSAMLQTFVRDYAGDQIDEGDA